MTASVFRLFGSWEFGKFAENLPDRPRPVSRDEYADALSAGWVPPVPVANVAMRPAMQTGSPALDAEDFLTRVYRYQQC